jgi:hypothetical protein
MHDAHARILMLGIAESYEQIAKSYEKIAKGHNTRVSQNCRPTPFVGEGRGGSIIPSPARARSRNDMREI